MVREQGEDWPLEDRAEAIREQLPRLTTAAELRIWLADPRTVRLRTKLQMSPLHHGLWREIEGEIAAHCWALGEEKKDDDADTAGA